MKTTLSIIIPHRNIPNLLQKCIDSIPIRDDIQVIVVDDNSDPNIVDFTNFPGSNNPMVEIHLTKEGKGAGYAKNIGLIHAIGKWIVIMGADDYFLPDLNSQIDLYRDSDADVVYFKRSAYNILTLEPSYRFSYYNEYIDNAIANNDLNSLLTLSADGGNFYKRSMITDNEITFNEVRWGNDVVFSAKVAVAARTIVASNVFLFCAGEAPHNLTKAKSIESQICRLIQECKGVRISKRKLSKYDLVYKCLFDCWFSVYRINKLIGVKYLTMAICSGGFPFIKQLFKAKFKI